MQNAKCKMQNEGKSFCTAFWIMHQTKNNKKWNHSAFCTLHFAFACAWASRDVLDLA